MSVGRQIAPNTLFDALAFDHLLGRLDASPAVRRWGDIVFDVYLGQTSHTLASHIDALIVAAGITSNTTVLDLGCGSGGIACYIAGRTACSLTGVDWSPVGISLARKRALTLGLDAVQFHCTDLHGPLPSGSWEVALAIDALYFGIDVAKLIAELRGRGCARVVVLATVPAHRNTKGVPSEIALREALAVGGYAQQVLVDLTESCRELVRRMAERWRSDLPVLQHELGHDLAHVRLVEDEQVLAWFQTGKLRRILLVGELAGRGRQQ